VEIIDILEAIEGARFYWPALIILIWSWLIGFILFCGAVGWMARRLYRWNKHTFVVVIAVTCFALLLWVRSGAIGRWEKTGELVFIYFMIPLGFFASIYMGISLLKRRRGPKR